MQAHKVIDKIEDANCENCIYSIFMDNYHRCSFKGFIEIIPARFCVQGEWMIKNNAYVGAPTYAISYTSIQSRFVKNE